MVITESNKEQNIIKQNERFKEEELKKLKEKQEENLKRRNISSSFWNTSTSEQSQQINNNVSFENNNIDTNHLKNDNPMNKEKFVFNQENNFQQQKTNNIESSSSNDDLFWEEQEKWKIANTSNDSKHIFTSEIERTPTYEQVQDIKEIKEDIKEEMNELGKEVIESKSTMEQITNNLKHSETPKDWITKNIKETAKEVFDSKVSVREWEVSSHDNLLEEHKQQQKIKEQNKEQENQNNISIQNNENVETAINNPTVQNDEKDIEQHNVLFKEAKNTKETEKQYVDEIVLKSAEFNDEIKNTYDKGKKVQQEQQKRVYEQADVVIEEAVSVPIYEDESWVEQNNQDVWINNSLETSQIENIDNQSNTIFNKPSALEQFDKEIVNSSNQQELFSNNKPDNLSQKIEKVGDGLLESINQASEAFNQAEWDWLLWQLEAAWKAGLGSLLWSFATNEIPIDEKEEDKMTTWVFSDTFWRGGEKLSSHFSTNAQREVVDKEMQKMMTWETQNYQEVQKHQNNPNKVKNTIFQWQQTETQKINEAKGLTETNSNTNVEISSKIEIVQDFLKVTSYKTVTLAMRATLVVAALCFMLGISILILNSTLWFTIQWGWSFIIYSLISIAILYFLKSSWFDNDKIEVDTE